MLVSAYQRENWALGVEVDETWPSREEDFKAAGGFIISPEVVIFWSKNLIPSFTNSSWSENRRGKGIGEKQKLKLTNREGSYLYTTDKKEREADSSSRGRWYTGPGQPLEYNIDRIYTGGSLFFKTMENYIAHMWNFVSK